MQMWTQHTVIIAVAEIVQRGVVATSERRVVWCGHPSVCARKKVRIGEYDDQAAYVCNFVIVCEIDCAHM
jgi:hypothetical protein